MLKIFSFLSKKSWFLISISLAFLSLEVASSFIAPFLTRNILLELQKNDLNQAYISLNIGLFFLITTLGAVGFLINFYIVIKVAINFSWELRSKIFAKIQNLDAVDIDKLTQASLLTRITTDVKQIEIAFIYWFNWFVWGILVMSGGIVSGLILSLDLSIVLAIVIPIILIFVSIMFFKSLPWFKKMQQSLDEINKKSKENILGTRVIKSFDLHEREITKFEIKNKLLQKSSFKGNVTISLAAPLVDFSINISIIILIWIGAAFLGNSIVSTVIPYVQVLQLILFGLATIIFVLKGTSNAVVPAKRVYEVITYKPSIKFGKLEENWNQVNIEIKNLFFKYYEHSEDYILENISLKIKHGQKIGFIGPSGSGKSSLASLFTRDYEFTKGSIFINNKNIKEYSKKTLNKNIAYASQKPALFEGTIGENIAFGLDETQKNAQAIIIESAKKAQAWEFISQKPKQLDERVEQRGTNFSGGQKQRISLARSFAKKAKLLILDESTSALDNFTESKIQNELKNQNDLTTLVISQKINSIKDADIIYVLNEGKIIDSGNHYELLNKNNFYYETAVFQLGEEMIQKELKK